MDFRYEFEIKLKRIAATRIAALCWEPLIVKEKFWIAFDQFYLNQYRDYETRDDPLYSIIHDAVMCKLGVLPLDLRTELYTIIRSMGLRLHTWYKRIQHLYRNNYEKVNSCFGKTCWTHYGSIDYKRTFEAAFLNNKMLTNSDIFFVAADQCLVEHMEKLWVPSLRGFTNEIKLNIFEYWQRYFSHGLEEFEEMLNTSYRRIPQFYGCVLRPLREVANERIPLKQFMVTMEMYNGNVEGAKFFWHKLTATQKDDYIVPLTLHLQSSERSYGDQERYARICAFLMNEMTPTKLAGFKGALPHILSLFLRVWPWQEFFVPTLRKFWDACLYTNNTDVQVALLINEFRDVHFERCRLKLSSLQLEHLINDIWFSVPKQLKLSCNIESYAILLRKLLFRNQSHNVSQIINDDDIRSMRDEICEQVAQDCIDERSSFLDFERLNSFFILVSASDMTKKAIKQRLNIWPRLVRSDEENLMQKFFNWQFESQSEYYLMKSSIDAIECCQRIIKGCQFDLADEFLEWYFEHSHEKINKFKQYFNDATYPCHFIARIWLKGSVYDACCKSEGFLRWLLFKEGAVAQFTKNGLINHTVRVLRNEFRGHIGESVHTRVDSFRKWCSNFLSTIF